MLTESEIKAIRYYIGDAEGTDPFWGDPKAYVVLNALFYPDIRTETARAKEGKRLNPAILEDEERLYTLLTHLLSACEKCTLTEERKSFRVERWSDYLENRNASQTISFTSTSTAGFLPAYADRIGITLMQFTLPAGTPCIPMVEVLSYYAKADEAEILLPPHLGLSIQEKSVPKELLIITDADGKPPLVFADVRTVKMISSECEFMPLPEGGNKAGQRIYKALMDGEQPSPEDITLYAEWKQAFIRKLW